LSAKEGNKYSVLDVVCDVMYCE